MSGRWQSPLRNERRADGDATVALKRAAEVSMTNRMQLYIDGAWVDPVVKKSTPVVNPSTEEVMYDVALGSRADVDKAVSAARRAFETFSATTRDERAALLSRIIDLYKS